jgi:hypothetical protein
MSGTAVPPRVAQVEDTLGEQNITVGRLVSTVQELEKRLDSILRVEPSTPSGAKSNVSSGVPLSNRINENTLVIKESIAKLDDILSRLEI